MVDEAKLLQSEFFEREEEDTSYDIKRQCAPIKHLMNRSTLRKCSYNTDLSRRADTYEKISSK